MAPIPLIHPSAWPPKAYILRFLGHVRSNTPGAGRYYAPAKTGARSMTYMLVARGGHQDLCEEILASDELLSPRTVTLPAR